MMKKNARLRSPLASCSYMFSYLCCGRNKSSGGSKACCILGITFGLCVVIYVAKDFHQQKQSTQHADDLLTNWVTSGNNAEGIYSKSNKYVVETSTCKIPEMNPFDSSVNKFLKPDFGYPVDCRGSHKAWTYMNGTALTVNKTAIHESGYSLGSIYCCYRIIERVQQPWGDYNLNADNYVKLVYIPHIVGGSLYSDKCHPLHNNSVEIDEEFIRVHCISKLPPLYNDVIYRDFFAIAQSSKDRLVSKKLFEWKIKSTRNGNAVTQAPPNVVIIGIDNNSRMNSHRHLTETLEVLRRLGAVEILGYTKVAENTFPNTVPFLSGYSAAQLEPVCYQSNAMAQDTCPYIWKAFDKVNYITVHAEDSPFLGGFNYLKTGFVKKPTDFYLRPLMLAVMAYLPRFDYYHTDCIGRDMTDEFTFKYLLDVLKIATENSAPIFVHNWLTSLAHHSYNNLKFGDSSISSYIESLVNISNDNTIFFFMSDHGQRYGPIRETTQGWYEDKLPTQWIYLPHRVRNRFPQWQVNLEVNAARLSSHFDVYKTMLHIIQSFATDNTPNDELYYSAKLQHGQSLFEPVPENRTCEDAGITVNFCACSKPTPVDITDAKVLQAAKASVKHLENLLPLDVCEKPTLKNIVSAGFLDLPGKPVYVITFFTSPGDFLFEVNVELVPDTEQFLITTDLLRMNKITRKADCVKTPLLERYCYCK